MQRTDEQVIQDLRMSIHDLNNLLDEACQHRLNVYLTVNRSTNHGGTTNDLLSIELGIKKNILP